MSRSHQLTRPKWSIDREKLRQEFKIKCIRLGITQTVGGARCGISDSYTSELVSGAKPLNMRNFLAMVNFIGDNNPADFFTRRVNDTET